MPRLGKGRVRGDGFGALPTPGKGRQACFRMRGYARAESLELNAALVGASIVSTFSGKFSWQGIWQSPIATFA